MRVLNKNDSESAKVVSLSSDKMFVKLKDTEQYKYRDFMMFQA